MGVVLGACLALLHPFVSAFKTSLSPAKCLSVKPPSCIKVSLYWETKSNLAGWIGKQVQRINVPNIRPQTIGFLRPSHAKSGFARLRRAFTRNLRMEGRIPSSEWNVRR